MKNNVFKKIGFIILVFILALFIQVVLVTSILYLSAKGDRNDKINEVKKTFMTIGKFFGIKEKEEKKPLADATDSTSNLLQPKKQAKFSEETITAQPEVQPTEIEINRQNNFANNEPIPDVSHGSNYQDEVIRYINEQSALANSLYYSQLDNYGKMIYEKLRDESGYFLEGQHVFDYGDKFNDLLSQPDGMEILNKSFQAAVNALSFDYPQLFFVDVTKLYLYVERVNKIYRVEYNVQIKNEDGRNFFIDELPTPQAVATAREQVEYIRRDITSKVGNDPYYAIKYVHDVLIDNIEYDLNSSSEFKFNMYSALNCSKAVCEGYAKAFKYIMDGLNIPTITVAGDGITSNGNIEKHAWNIVFLNGSWYGVDTTWDDPISLDGSPIPENLRYRYLLKGKTNFEKAHKPTGNITPGVYFSYPEISVSDLQF